MRMRIRNTGQRVLASLSPMCSEVQEGICNPLSDPTEGIGNFLQLAHMCYMVANVPGHLQEGLKRGE